MLAAISDVDDGVFGLSIAMFSELTAIIFRVICGGVLAILLLAGISGTASMRLEAAAAEVVEITSSAFLPCDDDLVMFELGVFVLLAKFGVDLWMEEFLANKLLEDDLVDRGIEGVLEAAIFDDTFPPAVLGFDLEFRGLVGGDLDANCDLLPRSPLLIDVVDVLDLVLLLLL